jgi:hypothetical protein
MRDRFIAQWASAYPFTMPRDTGKSKTRRKVCDTLTQTPLTDECRRGHMRAIQSTRAVICPLIDTPMLASADTVNLAVGAMSGKGAGQTGDDLAPDSAKGIVAVGSPPADVRHAGPSNDPSKLMEA